MCQFFFHPTISTQTTLQNGTIWVQAHSRKVASTCYCEVGWGGNAALRNSDCGIHQYIRVATSTFVKGLINILCESQIWRQAVDKCWSNMAWYKSGWNISGNVLKCQEAQPPNPGRTQHMHPHARATSCPWCLHDDFKKKNGFRCIQMQVSHIIWKWFTMQQCVGCVIW